MNLPTIIVLLVVLALVLVAIRALRKGKGNCSCGENGKDPRNDKCASCTANCPLKGK
ncbi:MAG: hypothetical protein IKH44_10720 [Bacteroidales bacterium]|nr:hypothetical protein [Bacteroidales bacterium]